MKPIILFVSAILVPAGQAAEVPAALAFLPKGELIKGAITVVVPPPDLDKFVAKVEAAAAASPEWFAEMTRKTAPGVPLPYDEKMGLTKEEYDEYLKLWDAREYKGVEAVVLQLREGSGGTWSITAGGGASPISTLRYDPKKDVFQSPNGTLVRLDDVKAEKRSILGEWSGHEWKLEEETGLGRTKENFAIGKTGDGKYGMIVYRMQEVSTEGTRLYDKSLVVRFPMGEAGILKPPAEP